jgi:FlaA1/EpsC-like NDP-sugar epimerase
MNPARLAILDKDENSIYELEHELNFKDPKIPIEAVIADIKIRSRVFAVFEEFQPEVVFHAAAHKHVPLMEKHPCEAVLNNIMGTKNVLEACCMHDTTRFIFISSDKAVNPTNIMGATKRVGEKLVYDHVNSAHFSGACVRFGNVMGSRGSVIPLFQKQIDEGGPVTVTHPDIVRFFMTIPEAVHLVLCAGSLAHRGELFVLDMGSPRKILDLARQVIELSGLEPDKDIQIAFTGLRPGEKMNEELAGPNEALHPTRLEKISVIRQAIFDKKVFRRSVARVIDAAERNDRMEACATLAAMELGFVPGAPLCKEPQPADCAIRAFLI